jgi:hypothetical protein
MEWISIKDNLPDIGCFCILFSPEQGIGQFVGYLEDDSTWKCYVPTEGRSIDIDWVTHWMYLPEEPKESPWKI